tara:strand:+ start:164 stop:598 length:435 start_codon:yes stop_codon:yes gene_type:complete
MIFNLVDPKELVGVDGCSHDLDRAELSSLLIENMMHYKGVGLSANQIGIQERAFVMMSDMETQQTTVCFNPRIIKYYKDTDLMEEGCLSYPDLLLPIPRHLRIVVKYEDENKKILKRKLNGFIARIFQHEYDHMEGIDFTQRQL